MAKRKHEAKQREGPPEKDGIIILEDFELSVWRDGHNWIWRVRIEDMYFQGRKPRAGQASSRALNIFGRYLRGEI